MKPGAINRGKPPDERSATNSRVDKGAILVLRSRAKQMALLSLSLPLFFSVSHDRKKERVLKKMLKIKHARSFVCLILLPFNLFFPLPVVIGIKRRKNETEFARR